jgi:hypothetical protein
MIASGNFTWYMLGGACGMVLCCILKGVIKSFRLASEMDRAHEIFSDICASGDDYSKLSKIVQDIIDNKEEARKYVEEIEKERVKAEEIKERLDAPAEERYRVTGSGGLFRVERLFGRVSTPGFQRPFIKWRPIEEEPNEFTDPKEAEALRQKLIDREGPWVPDESSSLVDGESNVLQGFSTDTEAVVMKKVKPTDKVLIRRD